MKYVMLLLACSFMGCADEGTQKLPTTQWTSFSTQAGRLEEDAPVNPIGDVPIFVRIDGNLWQIWHAGNLDEGRSPASIKKHGYVTATTECATHTIFYITEDDPKALRDTILHELFHAGACGKPGNDSWWNSRSFGQYDHPGIYHLAAFMGPFIRDNPQMIHWLEDK